MNYKKSLEEAANYARRVIPLMLRHKIPRTPENYKIWYSYVSGKCKELQESIDLIVKSAEQFTEEINGMLYQNFVLENDENMQKKVQENFQRAFLVIFNEVAKLSGEAEKFESLVSVAANKLSVNMSVQDIRNVLDEVIVETNKIGKSGKTTLQRLKEATDELELLQKEFKETKTELLVDSLTGVGNRKAFNEALATSIKESATDDDCLCLLMIDIDYFKNFNDKYGHIVGDEVLKLVANNIKKPVRGRDYVARFGGEEFAVILPKTSLQGAKVVGENIRSLLDKINMKRISTSEYLGKITVSIGAGLYRQGEFVEEFVNRSDKALYFAKETGRNRVATECDLSYHEHTREVSNLLARF